MEPELVWCSCCGKDIWVLPNTKIEDFLCTECKKIFDAYEGDENGTAKETKNNV